LNQYQNWLFGPLTAPLVIDRTGSGSLTIWMKGSGKNDRANNRVFVRDCPNMPATQVGCVTIAQNDYTVDPMPFPSAFNGYTVSLPYTFGGATYTVAAGHRLELKIVVRPESKGEISFAYDTTAYPSYFQWS
jgi:hypothetical protein